MAQVQPKEENNNRFKQLIDFMFVQMYASIVLIYLEPQFG